MLTLNLDGEEEEIEAIIFDMDNTLFDFVEAKIKACKEIVDFLGREDYEELFNYFLRPGVDFESVNNIADYLRDRVIYEEETFEKCQEIYEEEKVENIEPYEGVEETLKELREKGLKLGLVSDANRENIISRLEKVNLSNFFDSIVSSKTTGEKKPEPDSVILILEKLNVEPEKALLVGDSLERDIKPGKELGMFTAHAKYGDRNNNPQASCEADLILENIKELIR